MRVLLINQVFHPDPQATSQYLSRLARGLAQQGHQVTVLTGCRDYEDPQKTYASHESWQGVKIIRVWHAGSGSRSKGGRIIDFLSFLATASLRSLFLPRADLVVTLTTPPLVSVLGGALALLWKSRFVYWVMDLNPDEAVEMGLLKPEGALTRLLNLASRWSLHQAARVIVPDVYMRDRLLAKGVAQEKVEVIPLWIQDGVTFDSKGRESFRQKHQLKNKYVVMHAGNHTPCHPLDTLIEAAAILRDDPRIHFCFIGGGLNWRSLRDRAQFRNWTNTTFLGYQPEAELSGLLSAADVQVVVMGNSMVGIVHPCKVYNFLAAQRPFISIGPEQSHITDLIHAAELEKVAISFRHGESQALANELKQRADRKAPEWPTGEKISPWIEPVVLKKLIEKLTG